MFVYSVKGSSLKFAGVICLAAVLVLSLLILLPKNTETAPVSENAENQNVADAFSDDTEALQVVKEEKINYTKIRTNEDRIKFLEQFGWQVDPEPLEEATVKIPKTFDKVLTSYNALQLKQGLDLTKYSGKEVTRFSYKVTNYPNYTGDVTANIIVCKNRVIGGDVCSADVDGFIRGFEFPGGVTPEENPSASDQNEVSDPNSEALSEANDTAPAETQAPEGEN